MHLIMLIALQFVQKRRKKKQIRSDNALKESNEMEKKRLQEKEQEKVIEEPLKDEKEEINAYCEDMKMKEDVLKIEIDTEREQGDDEMFYSKHKLTYNAHV